MNINLSWDLFILVFFAIIIAYSFIIGRNQTLKVITGTYIAIFCSDGLGNLFLHYFASSPTFIKVLKFFSVASAAQATAFLKVLTLIVIVVVISIRGAFDFNSDEHSHHFSVRMSVTLILGLLSAGLMMSAMLIFVSGGSLVDSIVVANNPLSQIYSQSRLVRIMLDYSNIWFLMPGIGLMALSYLKKK